MKRFFLLIWMGWSLIGTAKAQWPKNFQILAGEISGHDTIPKVELPEVFIYSQKIFKNKAEEQQYWRLVGRVKKVLPYAKEAAILFRKYEQEVPADARRRDKRTYVKKAEDELMAKYGPVMKKMSVNDGRVLIKLIDRETNRVSYDIIQEVKGGVPAVFWQGIAHVFGNNLKSKYDPLGEDRQIEIIIQLIEAGVI
jgi:hypothetical protein